MNSDEDIDARITTTIEALRVYRRMSREALFDALGVSRGTYYGRMAGATKWSAADVKRAADALGVSVATLYDGLVLPHLDSNQKPAGYQSDQISEEEGDPFPLPRAGLLEPVMHMLIDLRESVAA